MCRRSRSARPGGRRIMDTCLQMALDVVDFGLDIQTACGAPLIDCSQTDWPTIVCPRWGRASVCARWVTRSRTSPFRSGRAISRSPTGVAVDPHSGLRYGGADPFAEGVAIGIDACPAGELEHVERLLKRQHG